MRRTLTTVARALLEIQHAGDELVLAARGARNGAGPRACWCIDGPSTGTHQVECIRLRQAIKSWLSLTK
jgi:hypothetical protein